MLGTGDVAIIYHISSATDDGWLAGQSDTASKPRRQLSNPRDSAARPGGYCTRLHAIEQILKMKPHSILADGILDVVAAGRRVYGARPGT
jgi:hypothetical protein